MRRISGETVQVADLVVRHDDTTWLEGLDLDGCVIVGPAVLMLAGNNVAFEANAMDSTMFWPLDDTRRAYSGAVGLRDCRFHECSFQEVGIAAARDVVDRFFS